MAPVTPPAAASGELLSAYLDGELRPGELEEVTVLLGGTPEVIAEFRALRDVRRVLRTLPLLEVPAELLPGGHFPDRLSAYLDGELPTTEMQVLVDHLGRCRVCREELHELDRSRTAVRALPRVDAPELFVHDPVPPLRRHHRVRRAVAAATLAAAALALVVGLARRPDAVSPVSLVDLGNRHAVRASVQPAFTVLPAVSEASP